jgi:hypothetical protein
MFGLSKREIYSGKVSRVLREKYNIVTDHASNGFFPGVSDFINLTDASRSQGISADEAALMFVTAYYGAMLQNGNQTNRPEIEYLRRILDTAMVNFYRVLDEDTKKYYRDLWRTYEDLYREKWNPITKIMVAGRIAGVIEYIIEAHGFCSAMRGYIRISDGFSGIGWQGHPEAPDFMKERVTAIVQLAGLPHAPEVAPEPNSILDKAMLATKTFVADQIARDVARHLEATCPAFGKLKSH